MKRQDITQVSEFTQGVARFVRIASNPTTKIQAWRRYYPSEPWRDRVEIFRPEQDKFYPMDTPAVRHISANDARLDEKVKYYLDNGISGWFEGDEPKGLTAEEE